LPAATAGQPKAALLSAAGVVVKRRSVIRMKPNKKRVLVFVALWFIYFGATSINSVTKKFATRSLSESFTKNSQQAIDLRAAAERYVNTSKEIIKQSPPAMNFEHTNYDQVVRSYLVTRYGSLALWFYICACLLTHPWRKHSAGA
jgi:hypothetical protein